MTTIPTETVVIRPRGRAWGFINWLGDKIRAGITWIGDLLARAAHAVRKGGRAVWNAAGDAGGAAVRTGQGLLSRGWHGAVHVGRATWTFLGSSGSSLLLIPVAIVFAVMTALSMGGRALVDYGRDIVGRARTVAEGRRVPEGYVTTETLGVIVPNTDQLLREHLTEIQARAAEMRKKVEENPKDKEGETAGRSAFLEFVSSEPRALDPAWEKPAWAAASRRRVTGVKMSAMRTGFVDERNHILTEILGFTPEDLGL